MNPSFFQHNPQGFDNFDRMGGMRGHPQDRHMDPRDPRRSDPRMDRARFDAHGMGDMRGLPGPGPGPAGFDPRGPLGRPQEHAGLPDPRDSHPHGLPERAGPLGFDGRFLSPGSQGGQGQGPLSAPSGALGLNAIIGRQKVPFPPAPPFPRPSVQELVQVPAELASFAADLKFQHILLRVKEQTLINFVSLNRLSDDFVESVSIDAPHKEAALLARNLIETHLKLQLKVKAAENRLLRVQTDLFSTQGEIASGQMVEFTVPPDLIGLILGKKGARIKQVEADSGVTSINVRDNGHIMIYGPDSASVQRAREALELQEAALPLGAAQADWLAQKANAALLADLKADANLMVAKVIREAAEGAEGGPALEVVGTAAAVQMARCLLDTQLEYVDRQIEIEANEREAREKLLAVRKQYGLNAWKAGGRTQGQGGERPGGERQGGERQGSDRQGGDRQGGDRQGGDRQGGDREPSSRGQPPREESERRGRRAGREVVLSPPPPATAPTASTAPSNLVLDSKTSSSQAVEDALDALITAEPPAPPARAGRQGQPKGGRGNARGNANAAKEPAEEAPKTAGRNQRGRGKQPPASPVPPAQAAEGDKGGLVVLPPPPVLVVPPAAAEAASTAKTNKRGKKQDNKQDKEPKGAQGATKEPMLVRINNPFLEAGKKDGKDRDESVPVPAPAIAPTRAGPPRTPAAAATAATPTEEAEGRRGNRRRKDHADLLSEVKVLSVESADRDLAAALSDKLEPPRKADRRRADKDKEKEPAEPAAAPVEADGPAAHGEATLPQRTKRAGPPSRALALAVPAGAVPPPPGLPPNGAAASDVVPGGNGLTTSA